MKAVYLLIILSVIILILALLVSFANLGVNWAGKEKKTGDGTKEEKDISEANDGVSEGSGAAEEAGDIGEESAEEENPEEAIASRCVLVRPGNAPIIGCTIVSAKETEFLIAISNQVGENIEIGSVEVEGCSGKPSGEVKNNEEKNFLVDGCNNEPGEFEGDLVLTYKISGEESYASVGGKISTVIK